MVTASSQPSEYATVFGDENERVNGDGLTRKERLPPRRSLWRNRDFLLLWSGQTVSTFGTHVSALALPLLVLALTESPRQAGLIAALRLAPYPLFSLPVGVLIDRWNRRAVMIACEATRCLAFGSVPLAYYFGRLSLPHLYLVACVEGVAEVLFSLAQIAALPRVVPAAQLPQAMALNESAMQAGQLVGPALGGQVIGLARHTITGAVLAYLVDSLTYLVSTAAIGAVRVPFQAAREPVGQRSLRAEMAEGLRFLWGRRRLRQMALLTMAVNFLYTPVALALIVLARDWLRATPETIGLVFSLGSAGGIAGAVVAPWLRGRLRFDQLIVGTIALWALATPVLAIAEAPPMLVLGWALLNLAWPVYAVTLVSYRLLLTPDPLQGRVNSAFRFLSYGSEPLGAALGGVLLGAIGPRPVLWLIALGLGLCALAAAGSDLRRA